MSPENGLALLEEWPGEFHTTTDRGYKVRTTIATIEGDEAERRRSAAAAVIAGPLRG